MIYDLYGFHRLRDNTFIMLNPIYVPVHARYILDGGGLRLIEVPGDDRRDASAGYFRLLSKLVLSRAEKQPERPRISDSCH